jgi:hypothetical protein
MKDINDELSKMIHHGHILIEEKAHLIHGLKDELKKTSEHFNKITEMSDLGKREAEMQYKQTLNEKQIEYKNKMKNVKDQYEHLIACKEEEL